jgi:hypothetical protein
LATVFFRTGIATRATIGMSQYRNQVGQLGAKGSQRSRSILVPAGGCYAAGEPVKPTEMDAVDFLRLLSGRGLGEGLLATRIVF